jgi:hypothetical protein
VAQTRDGEKERKGEAMVCSRNFKIWVVKK